jgi:hypothetical protein
MNKYFTTVKNHENHIVFAGIVLFESDAKAQDYKISAEAGGNTVILVYQAE